MQLMQKDPASHKYDLSNFTTVLALQAMQIRLNQIEKDLPHRARLNPANPISNAVRSISQRLDRDLISQPWNTSQRVNYHIHRLHQECSDIIKNVQIH